MAATLVLVTGQPGSGKTTIARQIAAGLDFPLVSKDDIKEALAEAFEPSEVTIELSRQLGADAFDEVVRLLELGSDAVADASWSPTKARPVLSDLRQRIVEVHCACPPALARSRYIERAPQRHWVHLDEQRFDDLQLWPTAPTPLSLPGSSLVSVDTSAPVDLQQLLDRVRSDMRN